MANGVQSEEPRVKDESRGKPKRVGVYASECLSLTRLGKASRGKAKAKTGIGESDLPGLQGGPRKRDSVSYDPVRAPRLYPDPEAAARLVGVLAGGSPASGTCPVATVVISGGGAGDQSAGSPDVKVPVGRAENPVSSVRGASNSTGRSDMRTVSKPRNWIPHVKRSVGVSEVPRPSSGVEGQCHRRRTGCKQPMNVPGSQRATGRDRIASESPEPLVGRLGGHTQRRQPV